MTGIVRNVESYGIFVELTPNLAGLAEYRDGLSVGQRAAVYIKSVIVPRMKIKLVLVDTYRCEGGGRVLSYYLPENCSAQGIGHMDVWRYSPPTADKCVETVFSQSVI